MSAVVPPLAGLCALDQELGRFPEFAMDLVEAADRGEHLVEADLLGPEHRPAPIDGEAIAEKVDDVDIAGPDGDAFLEDFGPLVDQRIHAALDDFLVGNLPPFDALLLRRLQDDVPNDRVRQGVAAFIFVEARAGFLPETAHLAEPVGDGRVALVLRPQMSLALADAPADVQAGEVAHA